MSDRIGRRTTHVVACIAFAPLIHPASALYRTDVAVLIRLGMVVGFVIPCAAMQSTLQAILCVRRVREGRREGGHQHLVHRSMAAQHEGDMSFSVPPGTKAFTSRGT